MELVRLKPEELRQAGIDFKITTLYRWHSQGVHPEIFISLNGRLFIHAERWDALVNKAITRTDKRVAKIKGLKEGIM